MNGPNLFKRYMMQDSSRSEKIRNWKINVVSHVYVGITQKFSDSSLKFKYLSLDPSSVEEAVCENATCGDSCLPHVCPKAYLKFINQVRIYIKEKLNHCEEPICMFETDFKVKENNPTIICLSQLGYSMDYIKEWLGESDAKLKVLCNLESYATVVPINNFWINGWTPLDFNGELDIQGVLKNNLSAMCKTTEDIK